jgi:methylaspartate mutase epsilon subunit
LTKHVLQLTRNQSVPLAGEEYEEESAVIEAQARAILDRVHDLGQGDTAVGTVRALEAGVIDVPFCPSRFVQNIVLTARDSEGAVRFLKSGNLPFTDQMLVRDRVKMAHRRGQVAHMAEYQMILQDIRWAVGEE